MPTVTMSGAKPASSAPTGKPIESPIYLTGGHLWIVERCYPCNPNIVIVAKDLLFRDVSRGQDVKL
jgi:hypothetical protein